MIKVAPSILYDVKETLYLSVGGVSVEIVNLPCLAFEILTMRFG